MKFTEKGAEGVKIAYIGGGSRGWAWGLMSDLVSCEDMSGEVRLYDINQEAAKKVGELVAQRAKDKGIECVVFDRGGYLYHGRVKALAEAAREGGLKF